MLNQSTSPRAAPALRLRGVVLGKCIKPNAFGNALGSSLASMSTNTNLLSDENRAKRLGVNGEAIKTYEEALAAFGSHDKIPEDIRKNLIEAVKGNGATVKAIVFNEERQKSFKGSGLESLFKSENSVGITTDAPNAASSAITVEINGKTDPLFPVARALVVGTGVILGEFQSVGDMAIGLGELALDAAKAHHYVMSLGMYEPGKESFGKFIAIGSEIRKMASNPIDFVGNAAGRIFDQINTNLDSARGTQDLNDWFEYGRSVGHATVDIVMAIDGIAGLGKMAVSGAGAIASKLTRLTENYAARRSAEVARAAEAAKAADRLSIGRACFVAGTMVHTHQGLKAIDQLAINDKVLSKNENSGTIEYKVVIRTIVTPEKQIYRLTVIDPNGIPEIVRTTDNHPFWVNDFGWIRAADLQLGNQLITSDNRAMIIDSIDEELELQTVYNIEVSDFHTYFVGDAGIFVHNADCGRIEIAYASAGGNSAKWIIDESGKLLEVSGKLVEDFGGAAKGNARSLAEEAAQALAGKRGLPGDQGGHAIAHRFLQDQGAKNIFAQEGNFNMSAYKTLENDYARALQTPGTEVNFTHSFSDFNGMRPNMVNVQTEIIRNGKFFDEIVKSFSNSAGQAYKRKF